MILPQKSNSFDFIHFDYSNKILRSNSSPYPTFFRFDFISDVVLFFFCFSLFRIYIPFSCSSYFVCIAHIVRIGQWQRNAIYIRAHRVSSGNVCVCVRQIEGYLCRGMGMYFFCMCAMQNKANSICWAIFRTRSVALHEHDESGHGTKWYTAHEYPQNKPHAWRCKQSYRQTGGRIILSCRVRSFIIIFVTRWW